MSGTADPELQREERAIYAIVTLAAAPVVFALVLDHQTIDGGGTVCLIAACLGTIGLLAASTRRRYASPAAPPGCGTPQPGIHATRRWKR